MTRSHLFRSLILALLVGWSGLVAFAEEPAAEPTAVLRVAYDADPVSLDPHEQLSGGTLQYCHLVFDPLVRWKKDMSFEPRLAISWEQIDPLTTRFNLRQDVVFHSGNPFTAADVAYTFERLKKSSDFKGLFAPFASVTAVDDHTVDVVTKKPYPLVLNQVTYLFPLDRKFYAGKDEIAKHGNSFASRNVSGTGPFTVTHREQGVRVDFTRQKNYWDKASPGNVAKVILKPVKEGPTRVAALVSGDVDFIAPVPPSDLERLRKNAAIEVETMTGTRIIMLQLNQKRVDAFKDARVRLAIDYAINNAGIARALMSGFATAAGQLSPPGYSGHNPERAPRYDLAKAKALMKEAGFEKGFTVSMAAPNNRYVNDAKIAVAVANMLKRINITVNLRTLPKAQYWPEFDKQSADIMMIGWHSDTEDSANFAEFLCLTRDAESGYGQYNNANFSNPKVDQLILSSQTETDAAARRKLLLEAEGILIDEAAIVPLHWQDLAWAGRKKVAFGPVVNVMNFPYFGDLVVEQ